MLGLDHDADALRPQHLLYGVGDLGGHLLLDLQAAGKAPDHPRQFGDADHPVGRQIADMGHAHDRQHVMFTEADEADVLEHDQLIIAADLLERPLKIGPRVDFIAGEKLAIAARHPRGCVQQPFPVGGVPRPFDQGAHGGFGIRLGDSGSGGGRSCHGARHKGSGVGGRGSNHTA